MYVFLYLCWFVCLLHAYVTCCSFHWCSRCRVRGLVFYLSLIMPMAALFVFNLAIFLTIVYNVSFRPILAASAQRRKTRLRTYMGLTTLLGLTWSFGLMLTGSSSLILQWIFTLLVSTQGFFLFLLQVATHRLIRKRVSLARLSIRTYFSSEKSELSRQTSLPAVWKSNQMSSVSPTSSNPLPHSQRPSAASIFPITNTPSTCSSEGFSPVVDCSARLNGLHGPSKLSLYTVEPELFLAEQSKFHQRVPLESSLSNDVSEC